MRKKLIHLHSDQMVAGVPKKPTSEDLNYGEIAINYNPTKPSIFIKNTDDEIVDFIDSTNVENLINSKITTSLSSESTDTEVPSAKVVYDVITENEEVIATALNDLDNRIASLETMLNQINAQLDNILGE